MAQSFDFLRANVAPDLTLQSNRIERLLATNRKEDIRQEKLSAARLKEGKLDLAQADFEEALDAGDNNEIVKQLGRMGRHGSPALANSVGTQIKNSNEQEQVIMKNNAERLFSIAQDLEKKPNRAARRLALEGHLNTPNTLTKSSKDKLFNILNNPDDNMVRSGLSDLQEFSLSTNQIIDIGKTNAQLKATAKENRLQRDFTEQERIAGQTDKIALKGVDLQNKLAENLAKQDTPENRAKTKKIQLEINALEVKSREEQGERLRRNKNEIRQADLVVSRASRVDRAVNRMVPMLQHDIDNPFENPSDNVSGVSGAANAFRPGSRRKAFETDINFLKSNQALQEMENLKKLSVTGATGLGATNTKEIDLLQDRIATLDLNAPPEVTIRAINEIRTEWNRLSALAKQDKADIIMQQTAPITQRQLPLDAQSSSDLAKQALKGGKPRFTIRRRGR